MLAENVNFAACAKGTESEGVQKEASHPES